EHEPEHQQEEQRERQGPVDRGARPPVRQQVAAVQRQERPDLAHSEASSSLAGSPSPTSSRYTSSSVGRFMRRSVSVSCCERSSSPSATITAVGSRAVKR